MKTSLNNIPVNKVIDPVRVSVLVITNLTDGGSAAPTETSITVYIKVPKTIKIKA